MIQISEIIYNSMRFGIYTELNCINLYENTSLKLSFFKPSSFCVNVPDVKNNDSISAILDLSSQLNEEYVRAFNQRKRFNVDWILKKKREKFPREKRRTKDDSFGVLASFLFLLLFGA